MRLFRSLSRNTPIAVRLALAIAMPGIATLILAVMVMSSHWDTAARMAHLRDAVGICIPDRFTGTARWVISVPCVAAGAQKA